MGEVVEVAFQTAIIAALLGAAILISLALAKSVNVLDKEDNNDLRWPE